jgi:hypothetical protein
LEKATPPEVGLSKCDLGASRAYFRIPRRAFIETLDWVVPTSEYSGPDAHIAWNAVHPGRPNSQKLVSFAGQLHSQQQQSGLTTFAGHILLMQFGRVVAMSNTVSHPHPLLWPSAH